MGARRRVLLHLQHAFEMLLKAGLRQYREWSGIDARLAVVGLAANDFTIADPSDAGMLDIAGFDAAVPTLLSNFSARAI